MVSLENYIGREQAYVKHTFLERYLEALVHKTASTYPHIVYVDGFAGPWQSANERFEDTSFGIALNALRRAKASWKDKRDVRMSALLVEQNEEAYSHLAKVPKQYPDVAIKTYCGDFVTLLPTIMSDIPHDAFAFFFVDPKGWRFSLNSLTSMFARQHSEVIFNFMFDFINRAASIKDPALIANLQELMPYGEWQAQLNRDDLMPEDRKIILVNAFGASLAQLGNYKYVAETTVLRPLKNRPLYCLCYATRHAKGIEVFRDCQVKALTEQSRTRAATKLRHVEENTGQAELFQSLHEMGPDELTGFLEAQLREAEKAFVSMLPEPPATTTYDTLWPQIMARYVVRRADVNQMGKALRADGRMACPNWEKGKQVPQPHYLLQQAMPGGLKQQYEFAM